MKNSTPFYRQLVGKKLSLSGIALSLIALQACGGNTPAKNTDIPASERIARLQVVDCLLPGQVRMLGGSSYMTPRRPAMITAAECETRGGEYVAYDRADMKSALAVWMESAERGEADAQVKVGEIFEKGLGGTPNYEAAHIWYEKAAKQGNESALFNLGTLYEQGKGVPQNKVKALEYYRQAWGLPADSIVFASAVAEQSKEMEEKLNAEIRKKDLQINLFAQQISDLEKQLSSAQQQANNAQFTVQIADLKSLVAELEASNQQSKQELLAINEQRAQQQKLRAPTVVSKDSKAFSKEGIEVVKSDINFGKYYALVIGTDQYDNIEPLDTPVNDVHAVAGLLEEKYGFVVEKVINADNISVMEAINNVNAQLTEDDNLLIFYAGHGERINAGELESGYWLPSNADAPPRDTNWVSNEFVTRHLARIKAKRVMVVADSCYAGLLSSAPGFLMAGNQANNLDYIKYKADKRSRLLMTSGGDKPVLDSTGGKHSIFTEAFIAALSDNESILTGPELFKAVHVQVVDNSKKANFDQEPSYKTIKGAGHEVGDFFFVPLSKG